ncbi:MAG: EF-hand domain-containing protein, partial [Pirellula sp.]
MKRMIKSIALLGLMSAATTVMAQPPRGGGRGPGGEGAGGGVEESVSRMMSFDKNKDGKLSVEELGDTRLKSLMERADTDKDGFITKDELTQMLTKEAQSNPEGGRGGGRSPGGRGPGGPEGGRGPEFGRGPGGPEGGRGPGGPEGGRGPEFGRGPGGPGGPDRGEFGGRGPGDRGPGERGPGAVKPGTVLPEFLVEVLRLDETQKASLAKLQATVDAELAKILTSSQQEQLKQMPQRGGPMGGPGREIGRPEGGGRGP